MVSNVIAQNFVATDLHQLHIGASVRVYIDNFKCVPDQVCALDMTGSATGELVGVERREI